MHKGMAFVKKFKYIPLTDGKGGDLLTQTHMFTINLWPRVSSGTHFTLKCLRVLIFREFRWQLR